MHTNAYELNICQSNIVLISHNECEWESFYLIKFQRDFDMLQEMLCMVTDLYSCIMFAFKGIFWWLLHSSNSSLYMVIAKASLKDGTC